MKKMFVTLLLTTLFVACSVPSLCGMVSAEESSVNESSVEESSEETLTSGDFEYLLNDDNTATVSRYIGTDEEVVVPSALDGHDVTTLGGGAFANCKEIAAIELPKTLTELKDSCFYGCAALSSISLAEGNADFQVKDNILFSADGQYLYWYSQTREETAYEIPEGVKEIWSSAFANTKLTDVTFPGGLLYVDDWAFSGTQIAQLELPDSVLEIGGYAFADCPKLTEIDFPENLEIIDAAAFARDANLTAITLHDNLQIVQMAAFAGTGLKEVTIPASVTEIGFCAFGYEEDMQTQVADFVIYGDVGSQAQTYCTDTDPENDYENHFIFRTRLAAEESGDDDEEEPVHVEQKEGTGNSIWKWILLGAGALVLLIGGGVLLLGGKKKSDIPSEDASSSKKTDNGKDEESA